MLLVDDLVKQARKERPSQAASLPVSGSRT
jgi:hypothetical protein